MTKLLSLILLAATAAVSLFVAQPLQAATAVVQPHRTILDEGARLLPGNMVLDVAVRRRVVGGVGVRRGVRRRCWGPARSSSAVLGSGAEWSAVLVIGDVRSQGAIGRAIWGGQLSAIGRAIWGGQLSAIGRAIWGGQLSAIGRAIWGGRLSAIGRAIWGGRLSAIGRGYMGRPALGYRAGYMGRPALGYRAGYLGRPALGYWAGERSMPAGMCPKKDEAIVILSKDPFCAAHHLSDDACRRRHGRRIGLRLPNIMGS